MVIYYYNNYLIILNNKSTFVTPFYSFYLVGSIIVYPSIQGTNRDKHFNHIICKGRMPTLAGNKHLSIHFFS